MHLKTVSKVFKLRLVVSCLLLTCPQVSLAQSIEPANDGIGTVILPDGNRIDISGGQFSEGGANLFHSFEQFGLDAGQIANFLANPETQNILGRVVGGDPSFINGLIQVSGGNANLFLMNPSGIVFGADAQLNVPASFFATTSTAIGFGGDRWFDSYNDSNWATLVGTPNEFRFDTSTPGSIANLGQLQVNEGADLTLLGGTVLNEGTLSAPGGSVTVMAVPGQNLVRIGAPGNLLSLDIPTTGTGETERALPTPLSLPELLTGGDLQSASTVVVNEQGQLVLTSAGVRVDPQPGTTVVMGDVSAADATANGTGGVVQLVGDRVAVVGAAIDASGGAGGGAVFVGGDYRGGGTLPAARQTYVGADVSILVDGLQAGDGGRVIVWANEATGFYGQISARGGSSAGNGGFVEISGRESLVFEGTVDVSAVNGRFGTLLLDPANIIIVDDPLEAANDDELDDGEILETDGDPDATFTISRGRLESLTGSVRLEATENITVEDLESDALNLQPGEGETFTFSAGGTFSMDASDIIQTEVGSIAIEAGTVELGSINAGGDLTLTPQDELIVRGNLLEAGGDVTVGDVSGDVLSALLDEGETFTIRAGGTFSMDASDTIQTDIGSVVIEADTVELGSINAASDVTLMPQDELTIRGELLEAGGNIAVGDINSDSLDVQLDSGQTLAIRASGIILINSTDTIQADEGNISIIGDRVEIGGIDASAGSLEIEVSSGIFANGDIIAGIGDTNGVSISLFSENGDIQVVGDIVSVGEGESEDGITSGDIKIETIEGNIFVGKDDDLLVGGITTGGGSGISNPVNFSGSISIIVRREGNIRVSYIDTGVDGGDLDDRGGDIEVRTPGLFTAVGLVANPPSGDSTTQNDNFANIQGEVLGVDESLPTSIYAGGGGQIKIEHGGNSFIAGPRFEVDENGVIVTAVYPGGDKERVFITQSADGKIVFRNSDGDDLGIDIDPVNRDGVKLRVNNDPLDPESLPSDASFSVGAITTERDNAGIFASFRDVTLESGASAESNDGSAGIQVRFLVNEEPIPEPEPDPIPELPTDPTPQPELPTDPTPQPEPTPVPEPEGGSVTITPEPITPVEIGAEVPSDTSPGQPIADIPSSVDNPSDTPTSQPAPVDAEIVTTPPSEISVGESTISPSTEPAPSSPVATQPIPETPATTPTENLPGESVASAPTEPITSQPSSPSASEPVTTPTTSDASASPDTPDTSNSNPDVSNQAFERQSTSPLEPETPEEERPLQLACQCYRAALGSSQSDGEDSKEDNGGCDYDQLSTMLRDRTSNATGDAPQQIVLKSCESGLLDIVIDLPAMTEEQLENLDLLDFIQGSDAGRATEVRVNGDGSIELRRSSTVEPPTND